MSEMLLGLKGCRCSILNECGEYVTGSADIVCEVLDVDEEWIKVAYTDKVGRSVLKMERTDTVERVEIF